MKRFLAMLLCAATCAACTSTPYQPNGATGGYSEEKIANGVYKLSYLVNANTPPDAALSFWHQRAKELCGTSDYASDVKLTTKSNSSFAVSGSGAYFTNSNWPLAVGTLRCTK